MMNREEWESRDMTALAELQRKGEVSPRELAETAIARIEALNPQVNAVICKAYDAALDELAARKDKPAWLGIPYLVKDLHAPVRGLPLTNGSRLFAGMPAPASIPRIALPAPPPTIPASELPSVPRLRFLARAPTILPPAAPDSSAMISSSIVLPPPARNPGRGTEYHRLTWLIGGKPARCAP